MSDTVTNVTLENFLLGDGKFGFSLTIFTLATIFALKVIRHRGPEMRLCSLCVKVATS